MELEKEKSRTHYKKFIFDLYKDFFTYLETQYLKKPFQSSTANELITNIGEILEYESVALTDFNPVFKSYVTETLKDCNKQIFEAFIRTRMSYTLFPYGSRSESSEQFWKHLHEGKLDYTFLKPVFDKVGPDFSILGQQDKAIALCQLARDPAFMTLFEENPVKSIDFMSHLIPLEYKTINLAHINFLPLFTLAKSPLIKFMSEPQKALVRLGRRLQHLEQEFAFPPERDEFLSMRLQQQETKIDTLRQVPLELPNCFKEPRTNALLAIPYIISTGYSFNLNSLTTHLSECYQNKELPTCPYTYKPLLNEVALPDRIKRVKNTLLADLLHLLVALIELRQIYKLTPLDNQEFIDIVKPFISSSESGHFYRDPVVALSGEFAGQTHEQSELLGRLRRQFPTMSHQALIDHYNIVPNLAIKDLVDHGLISALTEQPNVTSTL